MSLIKQFLSSTLRTTLGRKNMVRLGRFISNESRFDLRNDMHSNGETLIQQVILQELPANRKAVVLDVGANIGEWTEAVVQQSRSLHREIRVHAFEPCIGTLDSLKSRLKSSNLSDS